MSFSRKIGESRKGSFTYNWLKTPPIIIGKSTFFPVPRLSADANTASLIPFRQLEGEDCKDQNLIGSKSDMEPEIKSDKSTVIDIFKLPNMRKKSVILFYMW